jgi:hypothetical protein
MIITNSNNSNEKLFHKKLSEEEYTDLSKLLKKDEVQELIKLNYIVPSWVHTETNKTDGSNNFLLTQLRPTVLTYSYEWSLNMLKDAALCMLATVKKCLSFNLIINSNDVDSILYLNGKMQFSNLLAITEQTPNNQWPGYQDFLKGFLFPLLLSSITGIEVHVWLQSYNKGVPYVDINKLLKNNKEFKSMKNMLNLPDAENYKAEISLSTQHNIDQVIDMLTDIITSLEPNYSKQELHWNAYQKNNDYLTNDVKLKEKFLLEGVKRLQPKKIIDLGSNTGHYSRFLCNEVSHVVAVDSVSSCIDDLYCSLRTSNYLNKITPVVCNILSPSPSKGFNLLEYEDFFLRLNTDFFVVLAVMHHLTIPANISFEQFVVLLKKLGSGGVVEWISPDEDMSKEELSKPKNRHKIYDWDQFLSLVTVHFELIDSLTLHGGSRILCLLGEKK